MMEMIAAIDCIANTHLTSSMATMLANVAPILADTDAGFAATLLNQIWVFARVAIGIGLVIFVHELGHFAAAKLFGVKCEKFYVGFDIPMPSIGPIKLPSTLGKFRYGETEYGIGILPLGGYVKMLGQDDDPRQLAEQSRAAKNKAAIVDDDGGGNADDDDDGAGSLDTAMLTDGSLPSRHRGEDLDDAPEDVPPLDPRSYQAQPVWQRMIIISAGVVMNILTGILFAAIAYGFGVSEVPSLVGQLTPGGPAWEAGLKPGGRVIAVGRKEDPNMSFRKMSQEIMTEGLRDPQQTIPVTLDYGGSRQQYELRLMSDPVFKDKRMIGIQSPMGTRLDPKQPAIPATVAADVLTAADGGDEVVRFNETKLDFDSPAPATPLANELYSHPDRPIELTLRKTKQPEQAKNDSAAAAGSTTRQVIIPPQTAQTPGFKFGVGEIVSLMQGGPAETAGLKTGDRIISVDGKPIAGPYDLAVDLVGREQPFAIEVERGSGSQTETAGVTVTPRPGLQTGPPPSPITGLFGIQSIGIAFRPTATISNSIVEDLKMGDVVQSVRLMTPIKELPKWLRERSEVTPALEILAKGWEFSAEKPIVVLDQIFQSLPIGSKLELHVTRGEEDRIETVETRIGQDEQSYRFDRGIVLPSKEQLRFATGVGDALALGVNEGTERFSEVLDFLRMAGTGSLKLRHVGGPLTIFSVAKAETEKGISRQLIFLTLLSMNLAILNFLPIPALDGGHMMFLTYELVTGRRPNEVIEYRLTIVGFLLLISLMVVVFAQDISRLFF